MAKKLEPLAADATTPWMTELVGRKSRKRPPAWLILSALPPLHDGSSALPEAATLPLVKLLSEQKDYSGDPLLTALKGWLAPGAGDAFAMKLVSTWKTQKYGKAAIWLLYAAAALGEAATAAQLVGVAETLGGSRKKTDRDRAGEIVQAVAAIGSDEALKELIMLSRKPVQIQTHVTAALTRAARARKLSRAALVDALMPAREYLLSLDKPKSMPTIVKQAKPPELLDRAGEPVGKKYQLAVVRALYQGGVVWQTVKDTVQQTLDPTSASDFVLALLDAWVKKDFHGSQAWIGNALGGLGDDRGALTLKPHLQRLSHRRASDGERKKAMALMTVFGEIGTDTALLVLIGLGQQNTRPTVYSASWGVINAAASSRGLTVPQLEDRVTPDCGLDADGGRSFDYGPRRFSLVFDEHFLPRLADPDGGFHDKLPEAAPTDDADKVAAAGADWALMSKQLAEILDIQTERLRRSMVTGRRWSTADWSTWIKDHPLMVNYARRLVWGLHGADGALLNTFRAAEDSSLVDIEDDELASFPEGSTVSLVHPASLSAEQRAAWGEHLADYEIIAAFPQLGRPVYAPEGDEVDGVKLTRWADAAIKASDLYESLLSRGWDRDGYGYGQRKYFFKAFKGAAVVVWLEMDPGYSAGGVDWAGPQKLPRVYFVTESNTTWADELKDEEMIPLKDVDPVVFSEVVLDVYAASGPDRDEQARRVSLKS